MTVARSTLVEIGPREFSTVSPREHYRLDIPGAMAAFEATRLHWKSAELHCELSVSCDLAGTDGVNGVLSLATFNLSSARARSERAALLQKQSRDGSIPWGALLEEFAQSILKAERSGEPAIALRDIDRPIESDRLKRVFGFLLPFRHHSILFGDGASAKSYLVLYLLGLLADEGYRVLLVDWELDAADHRERYERLFGSAMPANLFYLRADRPLLHEADRIRRVVRDQGIDFAGYDSIGFGCHEAPESAESALAYFRAARQVGVGGLHVAHISKTEGADAKPFGSTFHHNSARATWNLKSSSDSAGNLTLAAFNRKPNLSARQQPFGINVQFTADRTLFTHCDLAQSDEFASELTLTQRIRSALKAGGKTRTELAAAFEDAKPDTLRRTIDREIKQGRLVEFPSSGGEKLIGLSRAI